MLAHLNRNISIESKRCLYQSKSKRDARSAPGLHLMAAVSYPLAPASILVYILAEEQDGVLNQSYLNRHGINSLPSLLIQVSLLIQLVYVNLRHAIGSIPFQLRNT